ncbi:Carbonic anhydrase 2 [Candidatus Sulfotelmatobacter sp. SbA7]|jgi:carbonic anhydrase|nr:Carbonic anhydrase 2 [Candidatus Sulfotelmatobacter sp. SbA7]
MRIFLYFAILLSFVGSGLAQHADTAQHSADAAASHARPSAEKVWADLMDGNKRFVAGKPQAYELVSLRRKLASKQSPNVIILSCSDSRVSPELTFDQSLGDLFVVRTAGNVADPVALGSIEYAVEHIHSPLLVVLGHQKCGAVIAACSGEKMPSSNLDAIMNKIGPAVAQAKTYAKADDLVEAAVKENVHQSAKNVLANSAIIRDAVKSGSLSVVEAEYALDTGEVVRLNTPASGQN